ncbi:MAG TPA: ankyrin repeat domain-containing protein [Bryobacteraceae bacterium]|nr:ankyrin repeat domain-containing protein [Bryobacteraceae bacterium]
MRVKYVIAGCAAALGLLTALGAANSPVADAVMNGDSGTVASLLRQKADVNAAQADGATAIQWAVYRNDADTVDLLIGARANVKAANQDGVTPLRLAAINGNAAIIEKLLKAGADANEHDPQGETPLMFAARTGNLPAIQALLDHKADVNAREELRGTTALMWAVEQVHPAAVKLLIDHGASVSAETNPDSRNSRLNIAPSVQQRRNSAQAAGGLRGGRGGAGRGGAGAPGARPAIPPEVAEVAKANGIDVASLTQSDIAEFASFFGRGPQVKDGGGLTALVFAAREDCLECARMLVEAGADVNQQTKYGWSPLLTATQNKHYKLAAYLLDHGANANLANKGGWTPLYLATDNRNIESGDYPVRKPDMDHLDFIKLLIARGANVNARICGEKSTEKQCQGDTTETRTNFTMQWLYEDGATPFLRAAQSGDIELMKLLLDHGADPKIMTAHNDSALAVAAGIGWVEGITFEWSRQQSVEAVKMCLDLGIDPNIADDQGRTALHGAAHKGRTEVIQILVDHGANLEAHDLGSRDTVNGAMKGMTWIPLDWARGLVRVGVQSAISHPEAEKLLVKLMTDRGMKVPPPPTSSICLTKGINGCQ